MVSASRNPPVDRAAISARTASSTCMPSASAMRRSLRAMSSGVMRRKSKRWQRDRTVSMTLFGSVVAKMNSTCGGGSSSVFSSAFHACLLSMCASSTMKTLRSERVGR